MTQSPRGTFAQHHDAVGAAHPTFIGASFKLKLSANATDMGYIGINSGGWCEIDPAGVAFQWYVHSDGKSYLKVAEGPWKNDYYLSASKHAHIGVYNWQRAQEFVLRPDGRLEDAVTTQSLSFYSSNDRTLYAWDAYNVLKVVQS